MRTVFFLLFLILLLPSASADHVYSHRYVVYGRVVDAAGQGVPDVFTTIEMSIPVDGGCNSQPNNATEAFGPTRTRSLTDANGYFVYCLHMHVLNKDNPPTATLGLEVGDAKHSWTVDALTRVDHQTLVAPDLNGNSTAFVFAGRAWRPNATTLEGVPVYGETENRLPVTLRVGERTISLTTNNYGDFAIRVDPAPGPTDVLSLEAHNLTYYATTTGGWASVKTVESALAEPPASRATPWGLVGVGAIVLGALARTRKA